MGGNGPNRNFASRQSDLRHGKPLLPGLDGRKHRPHQSVPARRPLPRACLCIRRFDPDRRVIARVSAGPHIAVDASGNKLDLLRNTERVINLDTEIAYRAFELCMSKQKLGMSHATVRS